MAVIYLKHPRHGTKVACMDAEAAYDRKHGWKDYNPDVAIEPYNGDIVVLTQPEESVNSLAKEPSRRGRPRKEPLNVHSR